jgi:hypothetical protein
MSTITPQDGIVQSNNYSAFVVGDKVIQLNGAKLAGTVTEVNSGGVSTQITVLLVNGTSTGAIDSRTVRRL